jgi:hypothetical protein
MAEYCKAIYMGPYGPGIPIILEYLIILVWAGGGEKDVGGVEENIGWGRVIPRWLKNLGLGRNIHLLIFCTPSIRFYPVF